MKKSEKGPKVGVEKHMSSIIKIKKNFQPGSCKMLANGSNTLESLLYPLPGTKNFCVNIYIYVPRPFSGLRHPAPLAKLSCAFVACRQN